MYIPSGTLVAPTAQVGSITPFSLACDDAQNNPAIGRRGIQFVFTVGANAAGRYIAEADLTQTINSGAIDKFLGMRIALFDNTVNAATATNIPANFGFFAEQSNQIITVDTNTLTAKNYDVLMPVPKFSVQFNSIAAGVLMRLSFILTNFRLNIASPIV